MVPLESVEDIYREISLLAQTASRLWAMTHSVATEFKVEVRDLVKVKIASDGLYGRPERSFLVSRFIIEMSPFLASIAKQSVAAPGSHLHLHLPYQGYFEHTLTGLKLLWLLRLSSALDEMDHNAMSVTRLLKGILRIGLSDMKSPNGPRINREIGSVFLPMILDDLLDIIRTSFGRSFDSFVYFIATCDPYLSVMCSPVDIERPVIVSSDKTVKIAEEIFLVHLCKQPNLALYQALKEIQAMQLPLHAAVVEPLRFYEFAAFQIDQNQLEESKISPKSVESAFPALSAWISKPNIPGKFKEKFRAQLEAVRLVALCELRAIDPRELNIFHLLKSICSHALTFSDGLRMRVVERLTRTWKFLPESLSELAEAGSRNSDRAPLGRAGLELIRSKENNKLCDLQRQKGAKVAPLLWPALVASYNM